MSQKYPKTYHLNWSLGCSGDDRVQYDTSELINKNIVITEKLDGSNACLTKGGVYGRSHGDYSRNPWDKEMWKIHEMLGNQLHDSIQIFGENMEGIHSIEYNALTSYFYIFGIRENGLWLSWTEVEEYAYLLGLPTVPVLFKGIVGTEKELEELTKKISSGKSVLCGEMEGLVVRCETSIEESDFSKSLLKLVRKNHVQTDESWQKTWKKAKINLVV